MWFSATVVQETCCAIETGSPSAPLIVNCSLLRASLACWRSWRTICRRAAMQPMLEPLAELMYGTPGAIAKAPRARGSCVFFGFVVWWLCVVGHCCSLFPSVACSCCNHYCWCCCRRCCCCWQTQHHDLGRKEEGRPVMSLLLPGIPQEQDQPHSTALLQKVTATLQSHPQQ